jgi:hypothetical protein
MTTQQQNTNTLLAELNGASGVIKQHNNASILSKLNNIARSEKVRNIVKSDMVISGKKQYGFLDAKVILPVCKNAMTEAGVIFTLDTVEIEIKDVERYSADKNSVASVSQVLIKGIASFTCIDTGQVHKVAYVGVAISRNDKSFPMAHTIAKKLAFCNAFNISGDEEDQENQPDEVSFAVKPASFEIKAWLDSVDMFLKLLEESEKIAPVRHNKIKDKTPPFTACLYSITFKTQEEVEKTEKFLKEKTFTYNEQYGNWGKQTKISSNNIASNI